MNAVNQNTKSTNQIIKSWVEDSTDKLYSWAFYKVSDKQIAEDLVQETFLAACKYSLSVNCAEIENGYLAIFSFEVVA